MPEPISFDNVFAPSGPPEFTVDQALRALYLDALIALGGDREAAQDAVEALRPQVEVFATLVPGVQRGDVRASREALRMMQANNFNETAINEFFRVQQSPDRTLEAIGLDPVEVNPNRVIESLIPAITGTDEDAAVVALHRGLLIARDQFGLQGPEMLHGWLNANVQSDDVLTRVGLDPEPIRALSRPPDLHPDVAALIELARGMFERWDTVLEPNPDAEAIADAGRNFAEFSGNAPGNTVAATSSPTGDVTTTRNLMATVRV